MRCRDLDQLAYTVPSVGIPSHTIFCAQMFLIPLKDAGNFMVGASTKQLYLGLAILFAYVFLDADTAKSFKLRAEARAATKDLRKLLRFVVGAVAVDKHVPLNHFFQNNGSGQLLASYGKHMIDRLLQDGNTVDEVVAEILPTAAGSVATQAQAFAQMLDVYLQPAYVQHWTDIRRCAYSDDPEDFKTLQKYALEACRLAPSAFGLLRVAADGGTIKDGESTIKYKSGDVFYTDIVSAGRDKKVFSENAKEIDVTRDPGLYLHQGMGPHACIGAQITQVSLAVQLGEFAKLKNLQRVPGLAGELKCTTNLPGGNPGKIRVYMTEDWSSWWPFPTSEFLVSISSFWCTADLIAAMKVQHEGHCRTLADHGMRRTDSGVGLPEILMNGHA
jgi:hypothetical protein